MCARLNTVCRQLSPRDRQVFGRKMIMYSYHTSIQREDSGGRRAMCKKRKALGLGAVRSTPARQLLEPFPLAVVVSAGVHFVLVFPLGRVGRVENMCHASSPRWR